MRGIPLIPIALFAACHTPDPPWASLPAGAPAEPTLTGAPVAVPKLPTAPVLDGKLDDAAWAQAATLGPFVNPMNGADEKTHPTAAFAKLGWDDAHLYIGFVVRDKKPTSPFGRDEVDPHVWGKSSGVELMLQPGDPGDNKDYYELQVDVNGAVFDSHFDDYNQPITGIGPSRTFGHQDWSSQAERAVFVKKGSFWSTEIAVPWSALKPARTAIPPKPGDVWRLNLYAFRDGQRLAVAWSPLRMQGNFHKSARFGRVQFR